MCVADVTPSGVAHPLHYIGNTTKQICNHAQRSTKYSIMSNSYESKIFSHKSYAMQTNRYHHTYESPKQYYSTQFSPTFNNDKIVWSCTKIITATTFKKFSRASYAIGEAHITYLPSHLLHRKRTQCAMPATSISVVAACGASLIVSRSPFKFQGLCPWLHTVTHGTSMVLLKPAVSRM